jgi:hypothetical protein
VGQRRKAPFAGQEGSAGMCPRLTWDLLDLAKSRLGEIDYDSKVVYDKDQSGTVVLVGFVLDSDGFHCGGIVG